MATTYILSLDQGTTRLKSHCCCVGGAGHWPIPGRTYGVIPSILPGTWGPRNAHALLLIPGKRNSDWQYAWIPVVGPLTGAMIAAGIFMVL